MHPPFTTESAAGGALVRVVCRLDAEGAEPLAQEIDRLLRAGEHVVRLDLSAVAFVSSAGIGALVAAYKKLKATGGRLERPHQHRRGADPEPRGRGRGGVSGHAHEAPRGDQPEHAGGRRR